MRSRLLFAGEWGKIEGGHSVRIAEEGLRRIEEQPGETGDQYFVVK